MLRKILGKTGLEVSLLGYGTMELSRISSDQAEKVIHSALDEGINFFDSSRDYPDCEKKLGRALVGRRDKAIIATKCGCNPHLEAVPGEHVHIWDRPTLQRNLDNSLRELKTDYIDIWQMHMVLPEDLNFDPHHETLEFMQEMKRTGKIGYIGASLRHGAPHEAGHPTAYGYRALKEFMQWDVFDTFQVVYGGMLRTNEVLIKKAADFGSGIIVRGSIKDYFPSFPQRFTEAGMEQYLEFGEDRRGFLLRFAASHPDVATIIAGTTQVSHLLENIEAVNRGPLGNVILDQAKERLAAVGFNPREL